MTLGGRIKEQRKKKGFSQEKIAELVGTSRQAVTKWESGQSIPCMENLITLAELFEVSLDELTSGISDSIPPADVAAQDTQGTQKKSTLLLDVLFVLVAAFAVWSILRIPGYIGFSMVGFLLIILQASAVLFVPIYLLWLRPKRLRHGVKSDDRQNKAVVSIKTRVIAGISACFVLFLSYLLCGHALLFLHGMRQWSVILFVVGLIIIAISAISNSQKVMLGTVAGYVVGFASGMLFGRTYYAHVGDDLWIPRHNAWQIWTLVYLAFIAAGIVIEVLVRRRK